MPAVGFGKKSQDWSYLTPVRALYTQTDIITDPAAIPDSAIIDTTVDRHGRKIERARNQTLNIYAIVRNTPMASDATHDSAVLYLFKEALWAELGCIPNESSSSFDACVAIGDISSISAKFRWALIAAAQKVGLGSGGNSIMFSFPWLPAGRYKASIAITNNSNLGDIIIAEQHTE